MTQTGARLEALLDHVDGDPEEAADGLRHEAGCRPAACNEKRDIGLDGEREREGERNGDRDRE